MEKKAYKVADAASPFKALAGLHKISDLGGMLNPTLGIEPATAIPATRVNSEHVNLFDGMPSHSALVTVASSHTRITSSVIGSALTGRVGSLLTEPIAPLKAASIAGAVISDLHPISGAPSVLPSMSKIARIESRISGLLATSPELTSLGDAFPPAVAAIRAIDKGADFLDRPVNVSRPGLMIQGNNATDGSFLIPETAILRFLGRIWNLPYEATRWLLTDKSLHNILLGVLLGIGTSVSGSYISDQIASFYVGSNSSISKQTVAYRNEFLPDRKIGRIINGKHALYSEPSKLSSARCEAHEGQRIILHDEESHGWRKVSIVAADRGEWLEYEGWIEEQGYDALP